MDRHRPFGEGLVYHAGGLGDFVLSLPAIERARQASAASEWWYWGPSERLSLLPGFRGAPAVVLEGGHSLWGAEPLPAEHLAAELQKSVAGQKLLSIGLEGDILTAAQIDQFEFVPELDVRTFRIR